MIDNIPKDQYEEWTREISSKIDTARIIHDQGVIDMGTKNIKIAKKEPVELQQVTAVKKRPDIDNVFKFYKVDSYRKA